MRLLRSTYLLVPLLRVLALSNSATPLALAVGVIVTSEARVLETVFATINNFKLSHVSGLPI